MSRMKKGALVLLGLGLTFTLAVLSQILCLSGFVRYGLLVEECPSGTPRPQAEIGAWSLRRGNPGTVTLAAIAFYAR